MVRLVFCCFVLIWICVFTCLSQNKFEKRRIARVDINIIGAQTTTPLTEQYRLIVRDAVGPEYSSPRIRDAIGALYDTKKVETVVVFASLDAAGDVELRFDVKRKIQAERIAVVVGETLGDTVNEEDLLFKLNLLTPGSVITEQTLRNNADEILSYLRDRGFYQTETVYERRPLPN